MNTIHDQNTLHISTRLLYDEFVRRDIDVSIIDPIFNLLEFTANSGAKHFLRSTCSDRSSATGFLIAESKTRTAVIATRLGIPTPPQITCTRIEEASEFLEKHKNIVIKPGVGSGGKGVSVGISTSDSLVRAFLYAKKYSYHIVIQQHIEGDDVRLLVIDGKVSSAIIRKPAHVIGDGQTSLNVLIDNANTMLSRNDTAISSLMHISEIAASYFLQDRISTIPTKGSEVRVVGPANVSLGGSIHEATHIVTHAIISDAELITRKLGLMLAGIDMIWNQATNRYFLIEVNATPGIDIHNDPFSGTSSNCVEAYVDWLIS